MKTDVAIVGGGPAGTTAAMTLADAGISTTIIEREQHPRFHIGESMTGECGALVRELGFGDEMEAAGHPVKVGVNVYAAGGGSVFRVPVMKRTEAGLVPASTWQVRRSTFDRMLFDAATERGARIVQGRGLRPVFVDGVVGGVTVATAAGEEVVEADVVVDASGQGTFLANAGVTGPKQRGRYSRQLALFSHVVGGRRDDGPTREDTLIFYRSKNEWAWFIPVDDEIVSVGVVVPSELYQGSGMRREEFYRHQISSLNEGLASRLRDAELVEPVRAHSNYSYEVSDWAGPGYVCVGDAHRFIDPVLSFGLQMSMYEGRFAAQAITDALSAGGPRRDDVFADHRRRCDDALDILQDVIDVFWEYPLAFARIVHTTHRDDSIDILAGRVYERESPGIEAFRSLASHIEASASEGSAG